MKKILFVTLLILFSLSLFSQKSHIQVIADPGISIFIDGVFKGVTNAEFGGLIIQDLEPGNHSIEAKKEGFKTQSDNMKLSPGQVLSYNIDDLFEAISISEKGEEDEDLIKRNIGNLKIQSLPVELDISIPGLGINYQKQKDSWTAEKAPSGEFAADFTWNAKSLSHTVEIKPEMESHYMVNMVNGEVSLLGIYPINPISIEKKNEPENEQIESKQHHTILFEFLGLKYHYEFSRLGLFFSYQYSPLVHTYIDMTNYEEYSNSDIMLFSGGLSYRIGNSIRPYAGISFGRAREEYTFKPDINSGDHRYGNDNLVGINWGILFSKDRLMFDIGATLATYGLLHLDGVLMPNIGIGYRF